MPLMDTGNWLIWQALKLYLPPGTRLTSVYRPAQAQLDFIVGAAKKRGYTFSKNPSLGDETSWQGALTFVRSKGVKVAAPGRSLHQRGLAYNLSGPNLVLIKECVLKAVAQGRIRLARGSRENPLIERTNNCVHVEIDGALLDHEPFEWA